MNKSPINYLVTIALGAIIWVVTAIFIGGSFSESLMLSISTPEEFLANFRIMLGIAVSLSMLNCLIWYYFGNLNSTSGNLGKAKRIWWGQFISEIIISVGILLILVFINLSEGILTKDWLITYALVSLLTWFYFWFSTFLMSPRTVVNIPLFK